MSHKIVNAALASRLKTMGLPTHFENAQFTPVSGTLYLSEAYLPADTDSVGVAFDSSREFRGIYQVSVMAPRDAAKGAGLTVAQQVQDHFDRRTFLDASGAKVSMTSPAKVVHCERVDQFSALLSGDRWMIPVRVRFRGFFRDTP